MLEKRGRYLKQRVLWLLQELHLIELTMKIQFKTFLWWQFSNYSRLLSNIKLNCNLKISNLQTVKTVSPTWLLITSKMSLVICIFLRKSLKKRLTYERLFKYEIIHKRQVHITQILCSKSKTKMHSCNEALSLKYFNKAKQFTILYNISFFSLKESFKFRLHLSI